MSELKDRKFYCLGTGTMEKCKTCLHEKTWDELNLLPDSERLPLQGTMRSIPIDQCRLTKAVYWVPVEKTLH